MNRVTIFRDSFSPNDPYFISLEKVIERIKQGKSKPLIDKIRGIQDKKLRDEEKKKLPSICFSGEFSKRANNACAKHSGYVAIDFDNLNGRLKLLKEKMKTDPHTLACFVSPTGNGLKVLVKVPPSVQTHAASCRALREHYSDEALDEFRDVARICYESYDPDIYFNPDSEVFVEIIEEKKLSNKEPIEVKSTLSDYDRTYENLKVWLAKKGESYYDGNKHKYLVKLAAACNRFGIDRVTTAEKLKYDYLNAAGPVDPKDFDDIVARVFTTYQGLHNTAFFEENIAYENAYNRPEKKVERVVLDERVLDVTLPAKDVIYLNDLSASIDNGYHNGYAKGSSTYFPSIDRHFTWKKGEVTLMNGIGNHGKSTMLLQMMLIKSVRDGDKWAVFCPEQNPPDFFYIDLMEMYTGKSFLKEHANYMSEGEKNAAKEFVHNHFYFIYPKNDAPTPDYINARFEETIVKHKISGCLIDPFNQLDNDWGKSARDDHYLSAFLSKEKRFALDHDVYKLIIAHPKGNITKNDTGNYNMPDVFDLAGGAMWNNKLDNILVYHRPYYSTDKLNTDCIFGSQKIKKQKLVGIPGEVTLTFDRKTNRFYDHGKSPFDNYTPVEVKNNFRPVNFYETENSFSLENVLQRNNEVVPWD